MKDQTFTVALLAALLFAGFAAAEPRIMVLPFEPIMDSTYNIYGEQVPILDYQNALQTMILTEIGKLEDVRVVEATALRSWIDSTDNQPETWNDPAFASRAGAALGSDFTVIGTYGEFPSEIRVDARIVIPATGEVPPGYTVSSTVKIWDDLPTAADRIARQIIDIITATGHIRPVSKGLLIPEGDLEAFDLAGVTAEGKTRLTVWADAPAPQITIAGQDIPFGRCERLDLMSVPPEKQRGMACKVAVLDAGSLDVRVTHRGYLPYRETLNLAPGKAYRLEVHLQVIETEKYR